MKQILQNMESGKIYTQEVPSSRPAANEILVRNAYSVVSLGTERTKVQTGEKSLLGKALARPDQVQQVFQKIRQEGLLSTWRKVKDRLSTPSPLGYSSAGIVIEIGSDVQGFQKGDRVACAGAQWAHHAEVIAIPVNLCTLVPPNVDLSEAATSTIGAIAMQGVRQADIRLGETVVVLGLGFLGQITQQILNSAGARVFGIDLDPRKIELAKSLGMSAGGVWGDAGLLNAIQHFSQGYGADAVLLTASSGSSDLIRFAGQCARDRARIVVVGDVPADVPRSPFYEKELSVYFSRSYGPGRYDPLYEEHGTDYPIGYVRWTENRNMQAYVELLSKKTVRVDSLLTHRYKAEQAEEAFNKVAHPENELLVGMLLEYAPQTAVGHPSAGLPDRPAAQDVVGLGMIGAGNFATGTLLPALQKLSSVRFKTICTQHGYTAQHVSKKYGFERATCETQDVLDNPQINAVLIATRHDSHGPLVAAALRAGKAVYVEKPLCLTPSELQDILEAQSSNPQSVMVGFNRRFSSYTQRLREQLTRLTGPRLMTYRINAGPLPANHWLTDPKRGGGRILGEVCHFIDLVTYLNKSRPVSVYARSLDGSHSEDVAITLSFQDGSQAQILYTAQGHRSLSKERLEVFASGHAFVLDDFQTLTHHAPKGRKRFSSWKQDKGYRQEMELWATSLTQSREAPISFQESVLTTQLTFLVLNSIEQGAPISVPESL